MKQLAEQDSSFLYLETPETPMHVGGLSMVELPEGYTGDFYSDYKSHIASRLHLVPMLTRKLYTLPLDLDDPVWVDVGNVDIDYHIRHVTLPPPGGFHQLEEMVGRLHSNFLDRSRPLWEFYIIDGLDNGQIGIYSKEHHSAMDGAASMVLVSALYDVTPQPRHVQPPDKPIGETAPTPRGILDVVAKHALRREKRAIEFVPDLIKAWSDFLLPNPDTLALPKPPVFPRTAPHTMFNVDITSQRIYAARTLPFADVRSIAKQAGVKVNDVVLAICAAVLRRYLLGKGALPDAPMTAMVPVSTRSGKDQEMNNQNSMLMCPLATDVEAPAARLVAISESSRQQKDLLGSVSHLFTPEISYLGSSILLRVINAVYRHTKLAERLPLFSNLTISNVQGPPVPLFIAGARIKTFYPVSIPSHGSALNITVESYCDSLDIGLTACRRTVPDLDVIADLFGPAVAELKAALEGAVPRDDSAGQ